jgi:hypothetical protein
VQNKTLPFFQAFKGVDQQHELVNQTSNEHSEEKSMTSGVLLTASHFLFLAIEKRPKLLDVQIEALPA